MSEGVEPPSGKYGAEWAEFRRKMAEKDLDGAWTELRQIADSGRAAEAAEVSYVFGRRCQRSDAPDDAQRARAAFELAYESGEGEIRDFAALRLARAAGKDGDVESAKGYFEHAARSGTERLAVAAAYELGVYLQNTGDVDGAQRWYRWALQFQDGSRPAWFAAVNLGAMRQAAGDLDSARELLSWVVENGEGEILGKAAYLLGNLLMREGSMAQAEVMFNRAVKEREPAAMLPLGRLLASVGRLAEAEAALRKAADYYGDTAALTALGDVLVRRVDPGTNLAHLIEDRSVEEFTRHYSSHLTAGPEIAEAEECYRQAAAAGERGALVGLGHVLMGTGRGPEAERVLRQAVQLGAAGAEAALAALLHSRGEDAAAARVLEPAVAAGNAAALIMRADLYQHENRLTEAADLLRRAVAAGGASLGAGLQLLVLVADSGDVDAAQDVLREMITMNDETGLAALHALVADLPPLQEDLRRARASGDVGDLHRFITHFVEAP